MKDPEAPFCACSLLEQAAIFTPRKSSDPVLTSQVNCCCEVIVIFGTLITCRFRSLGHLTASSSSLTHGSGWTFGEDTHVTSTFRHAMN